MTGRKKRKRRIPRFPIPPTGDPHSEEEEDPGFPSHTIGDPHSNKSGLHVIVWAALGFIEHQAVGVGGSGFGWITEDSGTDAP